MIRDRAKIILRTYAVANSLLDELGECNYKVTHLELQCLLYFAYGVYLLIRNQLDDPCLFLADLEAWSDGPIIKCIFDEFKIKLGHVIEHDERILIQTKLYTAVVASPTVVPLQKNKLKALRIVSKMYGHMDYHALLQKIQEPNTAWSKVYVPSEHHIITRELMQIEFTARWEELERGIKKELTAYH